MLRFRYPGPWEIKSKEIWFKLFFSLLVFSALAITGDFVTNDSPMLRVVGNHILFYTSFLPEATTP